MHTHVHTHTHAHNMDTLAELQGMRFDREAVTCVHILASLQWLTSFLVVGRNQKLQNRLLHAIEHV